MASTFTAPKTVTHEEWLEARKTLLVKEKEATRAIDALAASRRSLPAIKISKPYHFTSLTGTQHTLPDIFDGRRQLIIYHLMFAESWESACSGCSVLMDNLGHLSHLHARNTTWVAVSSAPIGKLAEFQKRMGWTFPWYTVGEDSEFNKDFGVLPKGEGREYNYSLTKHEGEMFGASCFLKEGEEMLYTYSTYERGLQLTNGTEMWLDMTAMGRQEHMGTLKLHDLY